MPWFSNTSALVRKAVELSDTKAQEDGLVRLPLGFHLVIACGLRIKPAPVWFLERVIYVTKFVSSASCCDRKPERQVRKASHCGSKQQQRSHAMITLF